MCYSMAVGAGGVAQDRTDPVKIVDREDEYLDEVLSLAAKGTTELFAAQREAIAAL